MLTVIKSSPHLLLITFAVLYVQTCLDFSYFTTERRPLSLKISSVWPCSGHWKTSSELMSIDCQVIVHLVKIGIISSQKKDECCYQIRVEDSFLYYLNILALAWWDKRVLKCFSSSWFENSHCMIPAGGSRNYLSPLYLAIPGKPWWFSSLALDSKEDDRLRPLTRRWNLFPKYLKIDRVGNG